MSNDNLQAFSGESLRNGQRKPLGHHRVNPRGRRRFQRKFKETISMNLANIGTLSRASCMAYSITERKCPILFFKGKNGEENLFAPFRLP